MEKRGELTSKQIVTIIILIVSFAVILIFFFTLNLKSEINSETCRNSVILRGTALGESTRLNCKTEDVCFSKTNECDEELKDMIVIKVENKQEFLDEASDLVYNCYWMMGEGKVDYSSSAALSGNYCAICDRIYFDKSLEGSDIIKVSNIELYTHLKGKRVPNGDNNLLFEIYSVNNIDSIFSQIQESYSSKNKGSSIKIADLPVFVDGKSSVLVTGIYAEGFLRDTLIGIVGGAAIIGGIALAVPSLGTSLTISAAGAGAVVGGGFGLVKGGENFNSLPPSYYVNDPDVLGGLKCKEFSTLS